MKRRLFNLAAILSLLLCLGTALLWGRSYWRWDNVNYCVGDASHRKIYIMTSKNGVFGFHRHWYDVRDASNRLFGLYWTSRAPEPGQGVFQSNGWAGFSYYDLREKYVPGIFQDRGRILSTVPFWFIFGLLAILPTRWAVLKRREMKRKTLGCCKKCGYDLRATPERCPECGTIASESAKSGPADGT